MKILHQLNPIQKQATSNPEGAHLVMAGPGSGKTQILSARIMSMMLSDSQIQPSMILALTYTEAGALAMRQRLVRNIGKDGYKIAVHTFHGLCNEIIQHNPDYFGILDLDVVSDIEAIQIIKNIIDGLKPDNPLYRGKGDQYWEVGRLRNLFRLMKNEDVKFHEIGRAASDYIKDLPENEDFQYKRGNKKKIFITPDGEERPLQAGDPNMVKIKEEISKMEKLMAGALLLDEYNRQLVSLKRYDFEDMIHWVIDAFHNAEYMKLYYQERYQYILVDEMQDTSGAQMTFLKLMIDFWEQPNIFVVGDLNQTLFQFSGARIANITDFVTSYNPATYVLDMNYRSGQSILDHSKLVIDNNPELLGEVSLIAKRKSKVNNVPEVHEYGTIFEEEAGVIDAINNLPDDVKYNQVAIIYRKHRQGENIAKALSVSGVPVNVKKKVNVLQEPVSKFIINVLKVLDGYHKKTFKEKLSTLAPVIYSEYAGQDLKIVSEWLFKIRSSDSKSSSGEIDENIQPFWDKIENLAHDQHTTPLLLVVEKIISNFNIIPTVSTKPNRYQLISFIHSLFGFIKSETRKSPNMNIGQFLNILAVMEENNISLETNTLIHDNEGVNMLTVHGAKGLEFKYVFMIGCTRNEWEGSRTPATNYKFPPSLNLTEENKENTNRRLFYVAMTRAEDHLIISYSSHDNKSKELEPTQFITEADLPVEIIHPSDKIIDSLLLITTPDVNSALRMQHLEEGIFNEFLENYTMSASHVNKYLKCQKAFFYENILRIPFVPTGALIFGNAVHRSLRKTYDAWKERKSILTLEEFIDLFRRDMYNYKGQMLPAEFDRRMNAIPMLTNYYNRIIVPSNKITQNEFKVANVLIDEEIPFTGDFDKLEFEGPFAYIVDYKTGKYASTKKATKRGGDVWRQLVIYKLLFDQIFWRNWKFKSTRVEMIDDAFCGPIPIEITPEDEAMVITDCHTAYDGIKNQEFSNGCGKPECKWCNMG